MGSDAAYPEQFYKNEQGGDVVSSKIKRGLMSSADEAGKKGEVAGVEISEKDYSDCDEIYDDWYKCPSCKKTCITRDFLYCPCCGIKLKWVG